jgi:hypothetical protein
VAGSFWQDAWASFKAVFGPILTGAAFVLALLGPFYVPAAVIQVGLIWVAVASLVTLVVLLVAVNMIVAARRDASRRLPKTRYAAVAPQGTGGQITLILDRSELFGVNLIVTVYYTEHLEQGRDEVIERLIGVGRVSNVQQNGLVQVLVLHEVPVHADLWQRIRNREAAAISQVVVKPSIPYNEAGMEVRFDG